MSRREQAFIWGVDHLEFANLSWFKLALDMTDIRREEYYLHSVLNGPGHAANLVKETFQESLRNGLTNAVDVGTMVSTNNSNIVNERLGAETYKYSRIVDETSLCSTCDHEGSSSNRISRIVNELYAALGDEAQDKVFAWFLYNSGVGEYFNNLDEFLSSLAWELGEYFRYVMEHDIREVSQAIKWIGNRYRFEQARAKVSKIAREKLQLI